VFGKTQKKIKNKAVKKNGRACLTSMHLAKTIDLKMS